MSSAWGSVFGVSPQREVSAVTFQSDLRNLTPPNGPATVSVDGGVVIGDGLGGIYTWNPTDVRADNGSTVIIPNSVVFPAPGRWNIQETDMFLGAGTVGAPALTFAGDVSSGFYRPAANQIGVSISGVQKALFSALGLTLPSLTLGSVLFTGAGGLVTQDNANFFWDNVNKRLGINQPVPAQALDVTGSGKFSVSVATPQVNSGATGTPLNFSLGATSVFNFNTSGNGVPALDNVQSWGLPGSRWFNMFTSVVDSGVAGPLSLKTSNGSEQVRVLNSTSAANFITLAGQTSGNRPRINVDGTDSNIPLEIFSKGTGIIGLYAGGTKGIQIQQSPTGANLNVTPGTNVSLAGDTSTAIAFPSGIFGTQTNDNAGVGSVGEYVSSTIATGSSVALGTGVTSNVTSITLGAGDWDVSGCIAFTFGAATSYTNLAGGASSVSGVLGSQETTFDYETSAIVPTAGKDMSWVIPEQRFSLAGSTTIFLVAQGVFTVSTLKAYGILRARRRR